MKNHNEFNATEKLYIERVLDSSLDLLMTMGSSDSQVVSKILDTKENKEYQITIGIVMEEVQNGE